MISYPSTCPKCIIILVSCVQVKFVNDAIKAAKEGQPLHGVELIEDPSDDIIKVHLAVIEYNMQCRKFGSTAEDIGDDFRRQLGIP